MIKNENGTREAVAMSPPVEIMTSVANIEQQQKSTKLNAFDLIRVALSSTLAISIFVIIGHVVRHIAGPSAILSVLLAAFLAILIGTFYAELNCTIFNAFIGSNKRLMNVRVVSTIEFPEQNTIQRNSNNETNGSASNIDHNDFIVSDWLLPSYAFAYIFHGELPAFVIAWNLILEIIVCLALVAKAIVSFFDAIAFDGMEFRLQYVIPMVWSFSGYFDVVAVFIPILIGIPVLLLFRRNSFLNTVSIALSLLFVVICLIVGIVRADVSNWNPMPESNDNNDAGATTSTHQTGGFFAYGLGGMFQGAAVILFTFFAFDVMIMSRYTKLFANGTSKMPKQQQQQQQQQHRYANDGCEIIENFIKTIPNAILSINAGLFLCLLGLALALTTIQPYHLLDKDLPILSMANTFIDANNSGLRIGMRFIILIAGLIALVGSLYALLHALQRTIQMMFSSSTTNASTFKLFEKFKISNLRTELQKPFNIGQQNSNVQSHRYRQQGNGNNNNNEMDSCTPNNGNERDSVEWQTISSLVGCLLFALLSGLLASLFAIEHLINMLGIGTLLMLYVITIDIIILRYSIYMKHLLHQIPNQNGTTDVTSKPPKSMNLISVLLCVYCILSAGLAIFVQAIFHDLRTMPNAVSISIIVVLAVGLLAIVFIMGIQLKRNAIFEFSIMRNPLIPALVLFGCIFLFTSFSVWAWYRIGVWTVIGFILYFILKRFQNTKQQTTSQSGIPNSGFISDEEPSKRTSSKTTLKLEDDPNTNGISLQQTIEIPTNSIKINDGNESIEMHAIESVEFMVDEIKCKTNVENIIEHEPAPYETMIIENQNVQQCDRRSSVNKYDEISNADDIREICIEKREPNGNAYFIEIKSTLNSTDEIASNSSSSSSTIFNDSKKMENVLNVNDIEIQYESEPQHLNVDDVHSCDESHSDDEQIVKAVVHVSVETIKSNEIDSNDVKTITIQPQINEISMEKTESHVSKTAKPIEIRRKPNFRIGAYEAIPKQKLLFENDDKRAAFKMRLENLFGQNESQTSNRINSPPSMAHAIRFTNSAPTSLILLNANDDETMKASHQQCQSKLSTDNDVAAGPSKIPIPPIFNQQLYDTVGRRNKNTAYQTALSMPESAHEIDINVSPLPPKKPNLSRTRAHENLTIIGQNGNNNVDTNDDNNDSGSETIKQKLEEIFSRGRIQNNNDVEMSVDDTVDQNDGIVLRKIKPIEPFDTVKRQKLIFSNVLKSIRPDSSINLRRTSSITSADIKSIQPTETVV